MTRPTILACAALALAALLVPPQAVAVLAVGADSPLVGDVRAGAWILKGMLLVHAVLLAVLALWRPPAVDRGLIAVRAPADAADVPAPWRWVVLGGMLAGALALRLHDLGNGLWFDEIQTLVSYGRLPLGRIVATFDSQNQHMLYSVLARVCIAIFGESAWALRLPAVLLGVASLGALYWFATLIGDRREALLATALLAVSYHHVWFSQNARGYTGLLLWTLLSSGLFVKLLREPSRGWGRSALYGVTMALAVYTHATAVFVAVAHFGVWVVTAVRAGRGGARAAAVPPIVALVLAGTFALQLHALVLPQFLRTLLEPTMEGVATEWKNPLWLVTETVRVLAHGVPGGLVTVVAAAAVVAVGIASYARRSVAVAAIMVLPGALTAAVLLALQHNLWPRMFFFSAGFAVLIAIRGALATGGAVLGARGRTLATAALVAVAAISALTIPTAYGPKQDYEGARDFVLRERADGDAVVTVDMSGYIYKEYLGADWPSVRDAAELERVEAQHGRTWLLYTFPTRLSAVHPGIWSRIEDRYATVAEFPGTVGEGTVVVKVNR